MARKDKHKDKPADAGAPGDDAPPVDVQPAPGEYDGNGIGNPEATAEGGPEPVSTDGEDAAEPVSVQDMPPVEPVSVEPVPDTPPADLSGGLSTLEAEPPATDAPKADADTPAKGKAGKGRYATREAKDERNRKEKERREAKARERAGQVARATGVAAKAAAKSAKDAAAPAVQAAADVEGVDLSVLLGLSFHALSMAIPERFGGGSLTAEERKLLGGAWAVPLAPYLKGAGGPWAMAAIATVQVFAVRAMTYTPPKAEPVAHSRPAVTTPAPAAAEPKAEPSPDREGASMTPAKRPTVQEPGVGED